MSLIHIRAIARKEFYHLTRDFRSLYLAFFIPLLIQAFQLAEELAETMEARGFGRPGRSFQFEYRFKGKDWGLIVGGAIFLTAGLLCRFIMM